MEIIIRILLFVLCLVVSGYFFDFDPVSIGILLGLYNLATSSFEIWKRNEIKLDFDDTIRHNTKNNERTINNEKKRYTSLLKSIIRHNNQTISKLITLINSTYSSINIDQQKNLLSSLISELDQQINYTNALCNSVADLVDFTENIKPLIDFKYSMVKQLQGKRPIKGINFNKLLKELQNLEDKISVE